VGGARVGSRARSRQPGRAAPRLLRVMPWASGAAGRGRHGCSGWWRLDAQGSSPPGRLPRDAAAHRAINSSGPPRRALAASLCRRTQRAGAGGRPSFIWRRPAPPRPAPAPNRVLARPGWHAGVKVRRLSWPGLALAGQAALRGGAGGQQRLAWRGRAGAINAAQASRPAAPPSRRSRPCFESTPGIARAPPAITAPSARPPRLPVPLYTHRPSEVGVAAPRRGGWYARRVHATSMARAQAGAARARSMPHKRRVRLPLGRRSASPPLASRRAPPPVTASSARPPRLPVCILRPIRGGCRRRRRAARGDRSDASLGGPMLPVAGIRPGPAWLASSAAPGARSASSARTAPLALTGPPPPPLVLLARRSAGAPVAGKHRQVQVGRLLAAACWLPPAGCWLPTSSCAFSLLPAVGAQSGLAPGPSASQLEPTPATRPHPLQQVPTSRTRLNNIGHSLIARPLVARPRWGRPDSING
jgi:hypothetical protein